MSAEFIDTNILIYAHDISSGIKHHRSIELMERLAIEGSGALSLQVLSEFYSNVTGKFGMRSKLAEEIVSDLSGWMVHRPAFPDLIRGIELHRRYNINWWDALILNSALELGCRVLWSEDFSNGQQYGSVTVRNPFL